MHIINLRTKVVVMCVVKRCFQYKVDVVCCKTMCDRYYAHPLDIPQSTVDHRGNEWHRFSIGSKFPSIECVDSFSCQ